MMLKPLLSLMASLHAVPSELILGISETLYTVQLLERLPPIVLKDPQ